MKIVLSFLLLFLNSISYSETIWTKEFYSSSQNENRELAEKELVYSETKILKKFLSNCSSDHEVAHHVSWIPSIEFIPSSGRWETEQRTRVWCTKTLPTEE